MLRSLLKSVFTAQYGHSGVLGLLSCIAVSFLVDEMVDITGLEPVASSVSRKRSARLSYMSRNVN